MRKTYDTTNSSLIEERHFYYNQQWQVLEERVGEATTADKRYVYHPNYVDAVAMRYDASDGEHYYLQDANFNVTAVVDDQGDVKERYDYTPYGRATIMDSAFVVQSLSSISNEFLYTDAVEILRLREAKYRNPSLTSTIAI